MISCTASSLPIIGLGAVERALKARRTGRCSWSTWPCRATSSPRSAQLGDVYLYTVDDLSALVQTAGEKRQAAVAQAEAIIETGVQSFVHWLDQRGTRAADPGAQRARPTTGAALEIARARKLLARGENVDAVLEALSRGLTQKMLHGALAELHADRRRRSASSWRRRCRACSCAQTQRATRPTTSVSGA